MGLLEKEDVQSPKEKILRLIDAEGIVVEESFNLSIARPFLASHLMETTYSYENGKIDSVYTILVPKFTDLTEKEQAIDLSFVLALYRLRKEKRWTKLFVLNSFVLTKLAWKKAEKICKENGIIPEVEKFLKLFRSKDWDFEERKKLVLYESLIPFKTLYTWLKSVVKIYLFSWIFVLFIWALHSSGAIMYFPFSNNLFGGIEQMNGHDIAAMSSSLFMMGITFYIFMSVLGRCFIDWRNK
ncbi:hypothetical protein [Bacillus sp. FSL R9-9410]|uniref:hypothetical protein n=1 Tax=Bacillus sp. FSL R9-9410 TaxID=2921590 RepID=UPI0031013CCA